MTIGWPRCFCSSGASGRKMLSVSPPAAHGTIILIGRSGNWAAAGPARDAAAKPRMAAARSGFLTCFLPSFFLRPAFQLVSGQPDKPKAPDSARSIHGDRRRTDRREPRRAWHRPPLLRSGRELSRVARRAPWPARHRHGGVPPRSRGGLHGARRCAPHRPSRRRLREPRPGREQRRDCGPHSAAGCGALDPADRAGGRGGPASRLVPRDRLRPHVRRHRQTGGGGRRSVAHSRDDLARPAGCHDRASGPGRHRAAGGCARGPDRCRAGAAAGVGEGGAASAGRRSLAGVARGGRAPARARRQQPRPARRARSFAVLRRELGGAGRRFLRRQDLFPNTHRLYAGDMGLSNPATQMASLREADLLLVLGARLSDITSQGWTFPQLVRPEMRLAHVHPDPAVIGTHFATDLAIASDPRTLIEMLGPPAAARSADRAAWIDRLKAEQRRIAAPRRFDVDDGVPFESVVEIVGRHLPGAAIVTVDAGTFGAPIYRIMPFTPPQRLLAPISGAMGFGVPAAVAAALRHPERPVICFVGDGGFLMTGNELALCAERKLALKVILSENRSYASIRIQQEKHYPGRVVGTDFAVPDFDLLASAFGFEARRIRARDELGLLAEILPRPGLHFVTVETSLKAVLPQSPDALREGDRRQE